MLDKQASGRPVTVLKAGRRQGLAGAGETGLRWQIVDLTRPRAGPLVGVTPITSASSAPQTTWMAMSRTTPDDAVDDIYADGDYSPSDQRWRPLAAISGIVFVLAVIATVVIVNGGDSASTSATVVVPPNRSASPRPSLVPVLPPETVTTPHTALAATEPDGHQHRAHRDPAAGRCPLDATRRRCSHVRLPGHRHQRASRSGHRRLQPTRRARRRPTSTCRCRGRGPSC